MKNLMRRIRELVPGLPQSKVLFSIGRDPATWTKEEWMEAFQAKNKAALDAGEDVNSSACCPWPNCEGHMLEGPSGGMSVNIMCDTCKRKWNHMGPFGLERI